MGYQVPQITPMPIPPKPPVNPKVGASKSPSLVTLTQSHLSPDAAKNLEWMYKEYPLLRPFLDAELPNCDSYSDLQELFDEATELHGKLLYLPEADNDSGHFPASPGTGIAHLKDKGFWEDPGSDNSLPWISRLENGVVDFDELRAKLLSVGALLWVSACIGVGLALNYLILQATATSAFGCVSVALLGWGVGQYVASFLRCYRYRERIAALTASSKPERIAMDAPVASDNCPHCTFEGQYLFVPAEKSLTCIRCGESIPFKQAKE